MPQDDQNPKARLGSSLLTLALSAGALALLYGGGAHLIEQEAREDAADALTDEIPRLKALYSAGNYAEFLKQGKAMKRLAGHSAPLASYLKEFEPLATQGREEQEIKRIEEDLKAIPSADWRANLMRYERLLKLRPDNARYQSKVKRYTAAAQRDNTITAQFSAWDGSHKAMVDAVKSSLHDAGSFEHVETRYWDNGESIRVHMRFRANNKLGGKVLHNAFGRYTLGGKPLEAVSIE